MKLPPISPSPAPKRPCGTGGCVMKWSELSEGMSVPDAKDVAAEFVRLCGGPRGFAKYLFDQAMLPTTSAHTKTKIFDLVLTFMRPESKDPNEGLGMLSEADLDLAVSSLVNPQKNGA